MECEAQSPGSRTALFVLQLSCSWHLQVLLLLQYSYQGTGEVIYYQSVFAHTTVTSIENIRALKPKRTYGNRSIVNTGVSLLVGFFNKQRAKNICTHVHPYMSVHDFVPGYIWFFLNAVRWKHYKEAWVLLESKWENLGGQFSAMRKLRACIPWGHSGSTTSFQGFSLLNQSRVQTVFSFVLRREIYTVSGLKTTVHQKSVLTSYEIDVPITCMYWHLPLSPTAKVFLGDRGSTHGGHHKCTLEWTKLPEFCCLHIWGFM